MNVSVIVPMLRIGDIAVYTRHGKYLSRDRITVVGSSGDVNCCLYPLYYVMKRESIE